VSTILKALRRLEEDKARGATSRPLREEVASGPAEKPRRRGLPWLPVAAMFVGAGIGASIWWVWPYERGVETMPEVRKPAPAPTVAAAPAPVIAPAPRAPGPAAPAPTGLAGSGATSANAPLGPEAAGSGPPAEAFSSPVEVVERPPPTPRIEPPSPGETPPRVIADPPRVAAESPALIAKHSRPGSLTASERPSSRSTAPEEPAGPMESAPAPAPKPAVADAPVKPAEPAPAKVSVASARAPAAKAKASAADAVHVKRTQWHPDAARRSAELEFAGKSESVREGDVVGEFVVTEIRPSGVVLTRDGEKIERGIGK
jgi:hypothetical protein